MFENAMEWLREHYGEYRFFAERDVVWTVQMRIAAQIQNAGLPYRVFNDHTLSKGTRADLVVLDGGSVAVAAEFKYEPSHARSTGYGGDIWFTKLSPSVVFWTVPQASKDSSVEKDVQRVRQYVDEGKANAAYSVFIDEGGAFSHRDPHPGSEWQDWGDSRWVLWSQVSSLSS